MTLSALIRGGVKAVAATEPGRIIRPKPQLIAVPAVPKESLLRQLEPFMLDLVADDPNPAEVCRVNNMAWEFMQIDGMTFSEAIKLAAEIVVSCDVAACEAAYTDVLALWQRLKGGMVNKQASGI